MLTINSRMHADASGLRAANQHQGEKRTNTCGRQHVLIVSAAGAGVCLTSMCWYILPPISLQTGFSTQTTSLLQALSNGHATQFTNFL
jgi:hypothetical protein